MFKRLNLLVTALAFAAAVQAQSSKPNVLFIFVDDLRPELGCYGKTYIQSPNIDRLASEGVLFKRQYVTVPTCGASRASLLTGKLPRTTAELSNEALQRKKRDTAGAIPESFVHQLRRSGYYTVGIGKVSHSPDGYVYGYMQPRSNKLELPQSWDEMLFDAGKWGTGWNAFFGYADGSNRNDRKNMVKPYEKEEVADEAYADGLSAELAVKKLKELSAIDQPFFLGVGFFKPHLPFNAPAKYWELYDETKIDLTPVPSIPQNVHPASLHQNTEFNSGYRLSDEKPSLSDPVSDGYARKLRHAYYASISYVDAQVGKVLDELKRSGLDKNTIVVLWGDHGFHLGDDRVWGKHTLFEWSLRSPLIIRLPGQEKSTVSNQVVSSIDIYPTLMELCGIKPPGALDGKSVVPLMKNDSRDWHNAAFSYFNKGITIRTDRYRLTKYFRAETPQAELYDHRTDPFEKTNVADKRPDVVSKLLNLWAKGNTGLYDQKEK